MFYIFCYLMIGCLAGIAMGSIGIGAGMITIPLLLMTGLDINQAVGASLVMQLLPQSLPGVMLYKSNNMIHWESALYVVLGSCLGIFILSLIHI